MIKGVLSGSAYLTAPLSAGCCEAIRRGGEKVKLTFKRKWCTLIAPCCLFHHWFSHFFMTLTLQSLNAFHLIEQTQLTRAVITALMIPIYFSFNEQTVGMKKTRKIKCEWFLNAKGYVKNTGRGWKENFNFSVRPLAPVSWNPQSQPQFALSMCQTKTKIKYWTKFKILLLWLVKERTTMVGNFHF